MIMAAVEEAEDIVVVEEEGMAEVGMAQEAGDVTTIVEAGEDMVVTVSFFCTLTKVYYFLYYIAK